MPELAAQTDSVLAEDTARIRGQIAALDRATVSGIADRLPGNAWFLDDGRVLCRARSHGDSRFPYGRDGFLFWVHASGYMSANRGQFFLLLPTRDGHEPPIAFFVGQRGAGGTYTPLALLPVPVLDDLATGVRDRCTVLGPDAAYFLAENETLVSTIRVFVDRSTVEGVHIAFSLQIENRAPVAQDLYQSAYMNPFCRHQFAESGEDRWFKRIEVHAQPDTGQARHGSLALAPFVVSVNEDVDRFRSVTNTMLVRRAFSVMGDMERCALESQVGTSRRMYLGDQRRGLAQAVFLQSGLLDRDVPLTVFNDNAIVGDLNRFRLPSGATARFDYVVSLPRDEETLHRQLSQAVGAEYVDAALARTRAATRDDRHDLQMRIGGCALDDICGDTFNHFLPYLREQVRVCAETRGFMQPAPNSLIGIRDVFQAIEGQLLDQPEAAKRKMSEALRFVLEDGRCPRQYSLPVNGLPGPADLRAFIDQGAWAISALYTYLCTTGDAAFLDERVGYHRLDASGSGIEPSPREDSVSEHLLRIMDYLLRQRDPQTGLLRALYGDWNDALDGLGTSSTPGQEFGTGVSVMASLQLYRNCAELLEILMWACPTRYHREHARFARVRAELRDALLRHAVIERNGQRRILHGWGDAQRYLVGSFADVDGKARDGLTSNAFWVLCDMLTEDPTLRPEILAAFDRLDSPFGLRTFAPGFDPDTPGVGRIPKLPIGTAENGATYLHATAFGVMALFRMNEPRRAWEQIRRILPFGPQQEHLSHSPFVMPNSYVYNPELGLTGESMNDWQTGSANVLLKALVWYVFGFRPGLGGLRIAPASWCPMMRFDFCGRAHGRRVRILYAKGDVTQRRFELGRCVLPPVADDVTSVPSVLLAYDDLSTDHENVITISDPE